MVTLLAPAVQTPQVDNSTDVFEAAASEGIGLTVVATGNLSSLAALNISADAKALITDDVNEGMIVIVPVQDVTINGTPTIAWAEIDSKTDEYIGVDSNGGHQGLFEFLALEFEAFHSELTLLTTLGTPLVAFDTGAVLSVSYELNTLTGSKEQAEVLLQADKVQAEHLFSQVEWGVLLSGVAATVAIAGIFGEVNPASVAEIAIDYANIANHTFQKSLDYVVLRDYGRRSAARPDPLEPAAPRGSSSVPGPRDGTNAERGRPGHDPGEPEDVGLVGIGPDSRLVVFRRVELLPRDIARCSGGHDPLHNRQDGWLGPGLPCNNRCRVSRHHWKGPICVMGPALSFSSAPPNPISA